MIVDFHVHIFPTEICQDREECRARDPHFRELYASEKVKLANAEDLIRAMDASDVDQAVVLNFGWSSHNLCVETNDYILDAARRFPGRLIPFCAVQPLAGQAARQEVQRCAAAGARGIGELMPDPQGFDLGDLETMRDVVAAAQENGLIVLTHASEPVGHAYPGKGRTTPDVLMRFVKNFPDLTVVFAHWGGGLPFYALMREVEESLRNVYFDTAAQPFLYQASMYRYVAEIVGVEKILLGSDYPLLGVKRYTKQIDGLAFNNHEKQLIMGGNAHRLLGQTKMSVDLPVGV